MLTKYAQYHNAFQYAFTGKRLRNGDSESFATAYCDRYCGQSLPDAFELWYRDAVSSQNNMPLGTREFCKTCNDECIVLTKPAGAGYSDDLPEYGPCPDCGITT